MTFFQTLGADLIIDYTKSKWDEEGALKGIDGILDTIGGDGNAWQRSNQSGVLSATGNYAGISGTRLA